MPNLVVPGVSVEARFDVLPPLPAQSGIVGVVGIVDRPPADGSLVAVSKVPELRDLLGPGTEVSMPEVVHALANGAFEAVVSAVAGGGAASATLRNADSKPAALLRCRSAGQWGNGLSVELRETLDADGKPARVSIDLLRAGKVVESFPDLRVEPGAPDDLFDTLNRASRYVVALDPGFENKLPKDGEYAFDAEGAPVDVPIKGGSKPLFRLEPAPGIDPTGLKVTIPEVPASGLISMKIFQKGLQEEYEDISLNPDSERYLPYVIVRESRLVRVVPGTSLEGQDRLPVGAGEFTGGTSPTVAQYADAVTRLADDPRIDLVVASVEPGRPAAEVREIHSLLGAHAQTSADSGAPRIAFGSVTAGEQGDLGAIKEHSALVRNRRFVLVSPAGAAGAVAGFVGRMTPMDSPTFKNVPLFGIPPARYREAQLNRLLGSQVNLLVVQERAGRGVVVLKGIDTTGDQISVTRVADQAIRETKAISENYIGQLNSAEARIDLREQLIAMFTRMERAGAIVPSTDGTDPAFLVDVYSTQQDFAQGIVRVDIAVRPVRAIDYVYATIRVKN